jgi:hypothetical protein
MLMSLNFQIPKPKRITTAPAGRGWKRRPDVVVNPDYVRKLLEEHRMTERDETLVKYLSKVVVLSSRQIKRLLWPSLSDSNMHRRLRELYDYHVLDRTRMLSKTEGITYTLGKAGRIWLYGEARGGNLPQVNVNQLAHDLALAEVLVLLVETLRGLDPDGRRGIAWDWWNEAETRVLKDERVILEPDALFRIGSQKTAWVNFYLEIDRGTERGRAFVEKIKRYHLAFRMGMWQEDFDKFPFVLIVTTSEERAANLAQRIASFQQSHDRAKITWALASLSALQTEGIFQVAWHLVQGDQILPGQRISLKFS